MALAADLKFKVFDQIKLPEPVLSTLDHDLSTNTFRKGLIDLTTLQKGY